MYYNETTIIYYKGEFLKAAEAKGNLYDQTLHYGYGVFEGIRAYETENGVRIFKPKEHFDRMQFSCEAIGIPYPWTSEELTAISYEVLERNNFKNAYLRPLVTCTPNMSLTKGKESQLLIAAWEWGAYLGEKLLRLKTSSYRRINPASFVVAAKVSGHYVNSIMATQEAKDLGFDLMPVSPESAASHYQLNATWHRDPFDRMLIWQAIQKDITLISKDENISKYQSAGLKVVW